MKALGSYRAREALTIERMMRHYCQAQHGAEQGSLCDQCHELLEYSEKRLARCPFAEKKPVCSKCPVHCYSKPRRAAIQGVMRWAGPRLLWRHPMLALRHLLDKHRSVPPLPVPKKK